VGVFVGVTSWRRPDERPDGLGRLLEPLALWLKTCPFCRGRDDTGLVFAPFKVDGEEGEKDPFTPLPFMVGGDRV